MVSDVTIPTMKSSTGVCPARFCAQAPKKNAHTTADARPNWVLVMPSSSRFRRANRTKAQKQRLLVISKEEGGGLDERPGFAVRQQHPLENVPRHAQGIPGPSIAR